MNLKLKALVAAAVVTVTMSGAANALTNNEMFLVATDTTGATTKTFIAALGGFGNVSTFTGASNPTVNFATDTNWTNFIAGTSAITYQVLGGFLANPALSGSGVAGDRLLISSNLTPGAFNQNALNSTMGQLGSAAGIWGGFDALNSAVTGTSTGLVVGGGADGIGAVKNNVFGQYLSATTDTAIDTDLSFWSITHSASLSGISQTVKTQFLQDATSLADVWHLSSSGLLTYTGSATVAAVPETNTWAMAMLGLGFMGFVARRRA